MSRNLVILCDGTWNSPVMSDVTHVGELERTTVNKKDQDQYVKYVVGVGNDQFKSKLITLVHKLGGGAFGWGLDKQVWLAYKFICQNYQPGDKVFIFGFSRGAFTARSLCGMLRKCGLAEFGGFQLEAALKRRVFKLYRRRGKENAPDTPHIQLERSQISPRFSTSADELSKRQGTDLFKVDYLGVWDTVGAKGLPEPIFGPLAKLWNSQYRFHDANLSSMVQSARHAVATDELRTFFKPTIWTNIDALNKAHQSRTKFQEKWFIGTHGIVGGSSEPSQLAVITLNWVLEPALKMGLKLKGGTTFGAGDPLAPADLPDGKNPSGFSAPRSGPKKASDIHATVKKRADAPALNYRPQALNHLL